MRILAIRGQNLASLSGEFVIDFAAEPLASCGIFAITGPTGAGKSTLLDAVSLALFNEIPRLKVAPSTGRVGESEENGLSLRDPRGILRHGAGEGYAEVDFAMPGGATYRARWSVKRARGRADGRLQNQDHSFERLNTGERIGGTRTETLNAIREVIGLTAEQFGRAVLLAQGDFEAFIRADSYERALLLERLTGSSIYAALGQHSFEKARGLEDGLETLRNAISAQNGLDDTARALAESDIATALAVEKEFSQKLTSLQDARRWEHHVQSLAEQIQTAREMLVLSEGNHAAAAARRLALERDRLALAHVPAWEALAEADVRLTQATQATEDATVALNQAREAENDAQSAQEQSHAAVMTADAEATALAPALTIARTLDAQLDVASQHLEQARTNAEQAEHLLEDNRDKATAARITHDIAHAKLTSAREWVSNNQSLSTLALRKDELTAHFVSYSAAHANLTKDLALQNEANKALTIAHNEFRETKQAQENSQVVLTTAQDHLVHAQALLPAESRIAELAESRDALTRLESQIIIFEQAKSVYTDARTALKRTQHKRDEALHEDTLLSAKSAMLVDALPLLAAKASAARSEYELLRAAASDTAETLRAELQPDQPCPVCGSVDHQLDRFVGKLNEHLQARETVAKALAIEHAECNHELITIKAQRKAHADALEKLARDIDELSFQLDRGSSKFNEAQDVITTSAKNLGFPCDLSTLPEALATRRQEVDTAHDALTTLRTAEHTARNTETLSRLDWEKAREAHASAREILGTYTGAVEKLSDTLALHNTDMERHAAALDQWLAPVAEWRTMADPEIWVAEQSVIWHANNKTVTKLSAELPILRDTLTRAEASLEQQLKRLEELSKDLESARTTLAELVKNRTLLLNGASVVDTELHLTNMRQKAEKLQRHTAAKREASTNLRVAAEARHDSYAKALAIAQTEQAEREAAFSASLAASTLTHTDIARVAQAGIAILNAEQAALADLTNAVTKSQAILDEREADMNRAETQRPDITGADLANALTQIEVERDVATQRRTTAEVIVRQDDAVREKTAQLRSELERESEKADIWLRLSNLIGDARGAKFRSFAQGLTLDRLLEHANMRLSELKPRYSLERAPGTDMLIQVLDNDMGGQIRGLHNLSGGERFLVSLALALGLAEMSTIGGVRIESLFIDEGFGALDPASLGQAIALLEQLHATGRRVGVISHVEELKERIPVKIEVSPAGRGTSRISIVKE